MNVVTNNFQIMDSYTSVNLNEATQFPVSYIANLKTFKLT